LAALLLALVISSDAFAQDRTALIIANFDYGEHQLSQVQADAAAVAEALRKEGFRVTVAENISGKELKSTVEKFTRSTVTRGVAFLYFAGLGGQYQTYNSKGAWWTHLQGAGKPADSRSPERESLALADILKLFADQSSALTNCLVIDAVRPSPYLAERQNQPTGLAAVDPRELPEDTCARLAGWMSLLNLRQRSSSICLVAGNRQTRCGRPFAKRSSSKAAASKSHPWFLDKLRRTVTPCRPSSSVHHL
jgi:hypothetical protein